MLPKTTLAPRPGRVEGVIHEPIETAQYDERQLAALIARTRQTVESGGKR
jgi:hypothetical protein